MSQSPGLLVASRVAMLPDGNVAEVVLDDTKNAYARWNNGSWSAWRYVGASIMDISIAAANVSGSDMAVISAIFRDGTQGFFTLTSSSFSPADL